MDGLKVLILEDDPEIRRLLIEALKADGHETVACSCIREYETATSKGAFDLFLIDINLPDGDGLEVAHNLRPRTKGGIILVTGKSDEIDTVLGLELGADDYITKPFRIRELRARIKSVVRRLSRWSLDQADKEPLITRYEIDGFVINRTSRSVCGSSGVQIDLTTLEFDLLVVLTTPPNVVLSREKIMDRLRGPDWSAYDRAIDGLVSRLRAKLFPDGGGEATIRTIRGVGYMFCHDI